MRKGGGLQVACFKIFTVRLIPNQGPFYRNQMRHGLKSFTGIDCTRKAQICRRMPETRKPSHFEKGCFNTVGLWEGVFTENDLDCCACKAADRRSTGNDLGCCVCQAAAR